MKKSNFVLSAFLLSIFLITLASGAITVNTPTSGLAVNGTYVFNITTDLDEPLNCTFATTSDGVFAVIANDTNGDTEFNVSNNTALLTEALATTLTVVCDNSTDTQSATQTFDIDNTDPTCSFIISDSITTRQSPIGIIVTDSSSDTTTITYSWVLTNPEGTTKQTSSSQNPTFSNGDLEDYGEHTITLTATDEVLKSCTSSTTFDVINSKDDKDIVISSVTSEARNKMIIGIIVGLVVIILAIAGVGWYITENSKRRK